MKNRRKMTRGQNKKNFRSGARNVHKKNLRTMPMRGGFRL